jgi:aspartate carbamoyltransferase catalytic subunit
LEDTVRCLACYSDAVVLRHPRAGAADEAAAALRGADGARKAVLNAGDGVGEHPTQALLDLYTLVREFGGADEDPLAALKGKTIAVVGDLKHGRTVHSLAKLLAAFDVTLLYVAPKGLELPENVRAVVSNGVAEQADALSLADAVVVADALYVTRIQKERFADIADYEALKDSYVVDAALMARAKPTCIILHPLPRVGARARPQTDAVASDMHSLGL